MAAIEIRRLPNQLTISTRFETTMDGIKADFDTHMSLVGARIGELGAPVVGPPFARFHDYTTNRVEVELGAPIAAVPDGLSAASGLPDGEVGASALPGGDVAATVHEGSYETIAATYDRIEAWIARMAWSPARTVGGLPHRSRPVARPGRLPDRGRLATWLIRIAPRPRRRFSGSTPLSLALRTSSPPGEGSMKGSSSASDARYVAGRAWGPRRPSRRSLRPWPRR